MTETTNRLIIFDTTLRDGEQAPGFSMRIDEKIRLARQLELLGVDVIEAGFPIASEADAEAVRRVSQVITRATVAALARCSAGDIDWAAWALNRPGGAASTFSSRPPTSTWSTSCASAETCLERAERAVELARSLVDDVEFSAEDATRTSLDFPVQRGRASPWTAGAGTINLPDTVGYALPHEVGHMVRTVGQRVRPLAGCVLSVHCHDDLGLAVANSLAGVEAGARQIECTINGIGERAGNASLEEIAVTLRVRQDALGLSTGIHHERLYGASAGCSHR